VSDWLQGEEVKRIAISFVLALGISIPNTLISSASDSFLGTIGPTGGIIFIAPDTPGNVTGSYFEAAPFNVANNQKWCEDWTVSLNVRSESIGSGHTNTALIAAHCSTGAAKLAKTYSFAGYSNWFLPSKNEMLELMRFVDLLQDTSVLALWTSTEQTTSDLRYSENAWCVYPRNISLQCLGPKYGENRAVRAVRLVSVSEMILFKSAAAKAAADKAAADKAAADKAAADKAAADKAAADKAAADKAAADKAAADKAAADKAAADKAAADKAAADKAAADKAAADKAAADKAAADKAATDNAAYENRLMAAKSKYSALSLEIESLIKKYPSKKSEIELYKKKIALFERIDQANISTVELNLAGIESKLVAMRSIYSKITRTITCTKGRKSLKVLDVNPKCPAGYKKK
jgi:hypothetical protein